MIRHYFVAFLRSLRHQKLFSFIILLGLTASLTAALLIYLYVSHELTYDRFHHNADRIYRVNQTFIWGDQSDNQFASTGPGVAWAIHQEIPEVEMLTSIHTPGNSIISYTTPAGQVIAFEEENVLAADTNFFAMFNFPFVEGNPATALREANTMVLTASTAAKYFGDKNPVGKLVRLSGPGGKEPKTYEVTGVVYDTPDNSYIQFDVLLSMRSFPVDKIYWSWIWTQLETFVLLSERANAESVSAKLTAIPRKYAEQTLQWVMNTTYDDYVKSGKKWELFLQPLTSIHLPEQPVYNRLNDSANIKTVYSLAGTCVAILLLACVNFMNLSTAQFTRRVKEASVRKILGQGRGQLAMAYFAEALCFCLVALLGALAITQWMLPIFNAMIGKSLTLDFTGDATLVLALGGTIFMMTLFSGAYPAWFLNNFNPAEAVKGKIKPGRDGKSFRDGLVVFQFALSIMLIISTGIVFQQLNFVTDKDLGFEKENLMVVEHTEYLQNGYSFAMEALSAQGVVSSSRCTSLPPNIFGGDKFTADGMNGASFSLNFTSSDEHYVPTLGLQLVVGRNFHADSKSDSNRVMLNETAIKKIGWPVDQSVIGKKIQYPNDPSIQFEVIGVIRDFNFWSLDSPVEPVAIFHLTNNRVMAGDRERVLLRVQPQGIDEWNSTMDQIETLWKKHAGDVPFQYNFVDDTFAETFKTSERLGNVLTVLALLAILIACLGLLGMITYALEQRTKEICIRKVSGASVFNILMLIAGGYAKLLLISFIVAAPLAWWLMNKWLQDFAYRISPSIGIFILAGTLTLLIAGVITAYHSLKVARINPVDVLRSE